MLIVVILFKVKIIKATVAILKLPNNTWRMKKKGGFDDKIQMFSFFCSSTVVVGVQL